MIIAEDVAKKTEKRGVLGLGYGGFGPYGYSGYGGLGHGIGYPHGYAGYGGFGHSGFSHGGIIEPAFGYSHHLGHLPLAAAPIAPLPLGHHGYYGFGHHGGLLH